MPKTDETKNKKSLKPISSKLINFNPLSQIDSLQNKCIKKSQRSSIETHQLNMKINRMFKQSLISCSANTEYMTASSQRKDLSLVDGLDKMDQRKQYIFSIPKIIKNINKTNYCNHNDTQPQVSSERKLFESEEEFVKLLKQKSKLSTKRLKKDQQSNQKKQTFENHSMLYQQLNSINGNKKSFEKISKQSFSNRSKTMHIESQTERQKPVLFSHKKVSLNMQNSLLHKDYKVIHKLYDKFQKYCKIVQKQQKGLNKNKFTPSNLLTHQNSQLQSAKKFSLKNYNPDAIKYTQKQFRSKKQNQNQQILKQTINKQISSSNLIGQNNNHLKVLLKSNSNNKALSCSKKISIHGSNPQKYQQKKKASQSYSKQTIKFINLTSYQHKQDEGNKNANFSWRGERIHHPQTEKTQIMRSQSRKNTNKSRYFNFERNMKISNNMHIVITQNNKAKINIFHNSLLLKEDPSKVDVLTSLVRDASKQGHSHRIQVPLELQINKLKIEQKSILKSGRESRKEIQSRLQELVKKQKQRRKQSVPRTRTQKKYQIRFEEVKPWEISDQREIQQSHQSLFNQKQFTYFSSKTIV